MGTEPESISSSKSFPQWMRSKIENKLDVDGVPFSPPAHDDSFFYIRYPSAANPSSSSGGNNNARMSLADQIRASTEKDKASALQMGQISAAVKEMALDGAGKAATLDLSKHTEPCRQYLAGANNKSTLLPGQKKSLGVDDGFKGAGAACGSSVVRVAHQMVNLNRPFGRGFTIANFDEADSELDSPVAVGEQKTSRGKSSEPRAGITPTQLQGGEEAATFRPEMNMMRRGSKSLPASPMGSPKAVRKNPYFTGIFTSSQTGQEHNRGWLLSSLLGVQREITQSTASSATNIAEETERETIEYESSGQHPQQQQQHGEERSSPITSVFRATKPSEIREMNFWTPTSM